VLNDSFKLTHILKRIVKTQVNLPNSFAYFFYLARVLNFYFFERKRRVWIWKIRPKIRQFSRKSPLRKSFTN